MARFIAHGSEIAGDKDIRPSGHRQIGRDENPAGAVMPGTDPFIRTATGDKK